MAVARVQFIAGQNGAGGQFTLTLGATVTAGDLLYVITGTYAKNASGAYVGGNFPDLPVVTDNLGGTTNYNCVADKQISLGHRVAFFVVPTVVTGMKTLTLYSQSPCVAYAIEYSGLAGVFDGLSATIPISSTATTWRSGALTTSGTGMLMTYAGTPYATTVTFAATTGTLLSETDNTVAVCAGCAMEQLNTAAATYNPTGTVGATNEVGSVTVAYK
jgi:hypothetical protein